MRLNDDQQKHIVDFMSRVWPSTVVCPMCKDNHWAIKNRVLEVSDYSENEAEPSGLPSVPLVALTCERCGYCIFLDAAKIGILNTSQGQKRT